MSRERVALAALLPLLISGLLICLGGCVVYGAMLKHGVREGPFRMTREFAWHINDPSEFWIGVGLVLAAVLSAFGVLCLTRAAFEREAPVSPAQCHG